jgi:hypothetical protein
MDNLWIGFASRAVLGGIRFQRQDFTNGFREWEIKGPADSG